MRALLVIGLAACLAPPAFADAVVAVRTLRPGTVITEAMVRLDPNRDAAPGEVAAVVGQELRVLVSKDRVIEPGFLAAPTLVARNQLVTLVFERAALRIETQGRALTAGGAGQVIRVMNNSSRATVAGRVAPDGSVIVEQN